MRVFLLLVFLTVPVLTEAASMILDTANISNFEFREAQFGQPPLYDMICKLGYCESQAPGGDGRITLPYDVYTRLSDPTTLAGVEISPLKYIYWKGQLCRILIPIQCSSTNIEDCADPILDEISQQDSLTLLGKESTDLVAEGIIFRTKSYLANSGALISAVFVSNQGREELFIDVKDKKLTDEVALAANPNYQIKPVRVPKN